MSSRLIVRAEERASERRTPLTPTDADALAAAGIEVLVESSPMRVFDDAQYEALGVPIVPAGSWVEAPDDTVVLGIKELPDEPTLLRHRHVYFGHAYKGQDGADDLLRRFVGGAGQLLDLEYLVNDDGRRVVAFGYWAGFVGASLGALHLAGELSAPLHPMELDELTTLLEAVSGPLDQATAVVTGAWGRAGRGAVDALRLAGVRASRWDRDDTANLDVDALLAHQLLVHCVHASEPQPPLLTEEAQHRPGRALRVVSDVTADVTSALNLLPVSDRHTTWAEPVRRIWDGAVPLDAIVIDNLPSLLPREASNAFSTDLLPLLPGLFDATPVWQRAADTFAAATAQLG